jgi:hypothetical protein
LNLAKADESQYATASRVEARKLVFGLMRRVSALKKREKSLLSNLSPEEERELSRALKHFNIVRQILQTRCAVSDERNSLVKRARPSRPATKP